jgi:hypothetical protein
MPVRKKSNTNFVAEEPRQGWAYFEDTKQWRRTPEPWGAPRDHFPKEYGDWVAVKRPQSWQPPQGTLAGESLLSGGAGLNAAESGGSGGGTGHKLGKGGHGQQPYDLHSGEYEGEGGSSRGPVFRGKVTPPNEVRGKVAPPASKGTVGPPLSRPLCKGGRVVISTKNDDSTKPDPDPAALNAETREHVQTTLDKCPGIHDANMNSGYRSGDPTAHGEGQAADINRINGQKVSDAVDPNVPEAQREAMRQRLREMRAAAEADPEVEAYIDPLGGFFRSTGTSSKGIGREADSKEKYEHRHHVHITIRKVLQTRQ